MSDGLQHQVLDLLWGMWRELGVPGTVRLADCGVIDPEALLVYTPALSGGEARLEALSFGWAADHHQWVSTRRLRSLAERAEESVSGAFWAWASPLARRTGWLEAEGPERTVTRTIELDLHRPSLAWLRARGVFGVGARADLVCAMLADPTRWVAATEVPEVGTTSRNVARILSDFSQVGLVAEEATGRARTFRLREPGLLSAVIEAEHARWPLWTAIFQIVHTVRVIEAHLHDEEPLRRVRTSKLRLRLDPWVKDAGWTAPPADPPEEIVRWCAHEVRRLSLPTSLRTLDGDWFKDQRRNAEGHLEPLRPAATMELRVALQRGVASTSPRLLNAMRESQIETFGWPIGIVLARPESFPQIGEDGIHCVVALNDADGFDGRASLDAWSCRTNGDFYLLKTLFEDQRDKGAIYYTTRMIRVAESLMRIAGFYRLLGVGDSDVVRLRIAHEGFQGRRLQSPTGVGLTGVARADTSAVELVAPLSDLFGDTASLVRQVLEPMFALFDHRSFESSRYEDIVRKYREGVISRN